MEPRSGWFEIHQHQAQPVQSVVEQTKDKKNFEHACEGALVKKQQIIEQRRPKADDKNIDDVQREKKQHTQPGRAMDHPGPLPNPAAISQNTVSNSDCINHGVPLTSLLVRTLLIIRF